MTSRDIGKSIGPSFSPGPKRALVEVPDVDAARANATAGLTCRQGRTDDQQGRHRPAICALTPAADRPARAHSGVPAQVRPHEIQVEVLWMCWIGPLRWVVAVDGLERQHLSAGCV